jgi:hypothetical protein
MSEFKSKESINSVSITGVLVKKEFAIKDVDLKDPSGNVIGKDKAIAGSLILRTADGSELEVNYYSAKTTKKGEENKIFKGLNTVKENAKDLENFPQDADIIQIGAGKFSINDYKGQDGEVKTYNKINANFASRLSAADLEKTPLESQFEITGVIEKMEDEIIKDVATGNVKVTVNVIGYEGEIIPIVLHVMKDIAESFLKAGFYEGGYAKFSGKLINTTEEVTTVEKQAFGKDIVHTVKHNIQRKEVTGGSPKGSLIENEIDEQEYAQSKSARKLKLEKIKLEEAKKATPATNVTNPFGAASATSTPSVNPFGK